MKQLIILQIFLTLAARDAIINTAIENCRVSYHVTKYLPDKDLHRHAACCKEIMSNIIKASIMRQPFKG